MSGRSFSGRSSSGRLQLSRLGNRPIHKRQLKRCTRSWLALRFFKRPFLRVPWFFSRMTRQTQAEMKCCLAALLAMCVGFACALIVLALAADERRSSEFQISGDWSITDLSGQTRGRVTFSSRGKVDSHDDFTGRWSLRDGCVHMRVWRKEQISWFDSLFPQVDEFVFVPQFEPDNDALTLQGAHVTLTGELTKSSEP